MCDPTMLLVASAAGSGLQAYGAYQSSKGQKAAHLYNAQVGEMQAQDALARGEQEVVRERMKTADLKGRQRAALGASGIDVNEGSALDILTGTDFMADLDAQVIRENAEREAWGHRTGAQMDRFAASQQRPGTAAATSLLGSGTKVASSWYNYKSTGLLT